MLYLILGALRSGKTILMTIFITKSRKNAYTNYHLLKQPFTYITPADFILKEEEFKNSVIGIDEIQKWIDTRTSGSALNIALTRFESNIGKQNIDIIMTAPLYSEIDKRFRLLADYTIIAERIPFYPLPLAKIRYIIYNNSLKRKVIRYIAKQKLEYYYDYYSTEEPIKPLQDKKMRLTLLETNPEDYFKELEHITEVIYQNYFISHKLTLDKLKLRIRKLGYPLKIVSDIYQLLKEKIKDETE